MLVASTKSPYGMLPEGSFVTVTQPAQVGPPPVPDVLVVLDVLVLVPPPAPPTLVVEVVDDALAPPVPVEVDALVPLEEQDAASAAWSTIPVHAVHLMSSRISSPHFPRPRSMSTIDLR